MTTGPDVPEILCYTPDGCCAPPPCQIKIDDFICQIRQLLPQGYIYNTTKLPADPTKLAVNPLSGECLPDVIVCGPEEYAPQLAVVDSFSAVLFTMVEALCQALKELDPCTADRTLDRWAERFGIVRYDASGCVVPFPDDIIALLVCLYTQLNRHVMNIEYLKTLAAFFGVSIQAVRLAGAFNCYTFNGVTGVDDPTDVAGGWWTMARDAPAPCPPLPACEPSSQPLRGGGGRPIPFEACPTKPDSINVVLCPAERTWPPNCNLPAASQPHDPDYYDAFLWLLPKIMPPYSYTCFYQCDPAACIN